MNCCKGYSRLKPIKVRFRFVNVQHLNKHQAGVGERTHILVSCLQPRLMVPQWLIAQCCSTPDRPGLIIAATEVQQCLLVVAVCVFLHKSSTQREEALK